MSKPVTVRNDTDADVVFRDRGGVRSVIPAGGSADVHHDDLEYLRGRGVVQDRSGVKPTTHVESASVAQPAPSTPESK